ncbi:MAG: homoserine kinase [Bacteroidales bacterium]|nr:homoserine kinase [Bacteroidales bacterium]
MSKRVRVKSPATVSNLNCGFDVIGLAIDEPYDIVDIELTDNGLIEIAEIRGCESLSRDKDKNVAGAVLEGMISSTGASSGFRVVIEKGISPGSGIGSSAASSAATAFAANILLDRPFSLTELVAFAMEGERLASGSAHADNVAPAIFGGITLVRSYHPLDIVRLNIPAELWCVVIHPQAEIRTSEARKLLDREIPLATAVRQWGNVGGLVAGFFTSDYDLIGRSLVDYVAEPKRSGLIPGFEMLKQAALAGGALGAGISGSGPSLFALCRGEVTAGRVLDEMSDVMHSSGIEFNGYSSPVNNEGTVLCE